MSDDRLFASNNAIGRKWYYINIITLVVITLVTKYITEDYIIPNVKTDIYATMSTGVMYFLFAIYLITFFALIDRRIFDIAGTREAKLYKNLSAVLKLAIFMQLAVLFIEYKSITMPIDFVLLQSLAWFLDFIFLIIVFAIGLVKGKISSLTYEQYKSRVKYR